MIDADPFLGAIYADTFQAAGFEWEHAQGGHEGIRAAITGPDAVILDVMMPRMTAFEILERLRAETATKYLPIVVLTDLGHRRDIERCMQLGVSGYMMKAHHTPQDVLRQVAGLLRSPSAIPSSPPYAHI
jgi:DNA-binding response OmpR family regulator